MTAHPISRRALLPAAAALGALLLAGPAGAQQDVNQRKAASATGTVEIVNTAGSVNVVGWNRNEVQVTGELGRGTERLDFTTSGGRTTIRVVLPRNARNVRGSDLEIRVPARSTVEVRTTSADVEVGDVGGAVEVNTVSGEIEVRGSPRAVEATSRSGAVALNVTTSRAEATSVSGNVTINGRVSGAVEAVSVSGDVEVGATAGEVQATTVNGSLTVANMTGRAEVTSVSGDVEITGRNLSGEFSTVSGTVTLRGSFARGGATEINSHSGEVQILFGDDAGAQVELTTFSGELDVDVRGARTTRQSRREQTVTVGRGGPRIAINTFSGDVRLASR